MTAVTRFGVPARLYMKRQERTAARRPNYGGAAMTNNAQAMMTLVLLWLVIGTVLARQMVA